MRNWVWSLLGVAAVLTSACHKAPAPNAAGPRPMTMAARQTQADLYPVTPGSRWQYVLRSRQADGSVTNRPMAIAITGATPRADGVVEATMEREYQSWSPPTTRVLRHPDKVVLSRLSDPIDGPSITVLRTPFEPGASWPGRPLSGGNSETIRAIGLEEVTVPAGTFKAYRVDHEIRYATGDGDTLNYWYAPGVGVVKMIERTPLYQQGAPLRLQVTGELETYTIGPAAPTLSSRGSAAK